MIQFIHFIHELFLGYNRDISLIPSLCRHFDSPCFCVPVTANVSMLMSGLKIISESGLLIDSSLPSPSCGSMNLIWVSISTSSSSRQMGGGRGRGRGGFYSSKSIILNNSAVTFVLVLRRRTNFAIVFVVLHMIFPVWKCFFYVFTFALFQLLHL